MKGPVKSDRTKAADRAGRNLRAVLTDMVAEPGFDAGDCQRVAELIRGVEALAERLYDADVNEWAESLPPEEKATA